jgi:hypothetical protein
MNLVTEEALNPKPYANTHLVQQLGAPDGNEVGAALGRRRLRQQRLPAACDPPPQVHSATSGSVASATSGRGATCVVFLVRTLCSGLATKASRMKSGVF